MTTVSAVCQKNTLEISLAAFDIRTIFLNLAIRYAMCTVLQKTHTVSGMLFWVFNKRFIPEVASCSEYFTYLHFHTDWLLLRCSEDEL